MIPALIGSKWERLDRDSLPVFNPATAQEIERVPLLDAGDVDRAVRAAAAAQREWSRVSVMERQRLMFAFKEQIEKHAEELAAIVTRHHGKTLAEARGEVRRGIEVVDFACAATTLLQGRTLRDVGNGVDQDYYRYPLGVVAGITPFNFPVMIPLWMFPLAVACGNTFVLKPSERTPLGAVRLAELFLAAGFPEGVLNVVHGSSACVDALVTHPEVAAVSFVGSQAVAAHVYREAARTGKRVQSAGGAKNHIFVTPDADLDAALPSILNSAFGNAGERCLAGSVAVAVGAAAKPMLAALNDGASKLVVGPGDRDGVDVGPLIRDEHRARVLDYIARGAADGARVTTDGRAHAKGPGYFLGPTILDGVTRTMAVARDEIFGPVLSVAYATTLDDAIAMANTSPYGNMSAIFTSSGSSARRFRDTVEAGMVGVNVGTAQPFGFFPFSGWKGSFYGDLHLQGQDAVEFYTRKKMVISRW
ncbi:MAG TPA: CoA-acylating methylmalonate-semialdehyde dehydrogenase [Candidatus Eremiobacteraceae bacterium]|nr:CoA-acylating methylmalonate-semialdehyde dehydrogenase [Candidatus Eremiobacteraceae bacterium]